MTKEILCTIRLNKLSDQAKLKQRGDIVMWCRQMIDKIANDSGFRRYNTLMHTANEFWEKVNK